jgi:hypothetical protein
MTQALYAHMNNKRKKKKKAPTVLLSKEPPSTFSSLISRGLILKLLSFAL